MRKPRCASGVVGGEVLEEVFLPPLVVSTHGRHGAGSCITVGLERDVTAGRAENTGMETMRAASAVKGRRLRASGCGGGMSRK